MFQPDKTCVNETNDYCVQVGGRKVSLPLELKGGQLKLFSGGSVAGGNHMETRVQTGDYGLNSHNATRSWRMWEGFTYVFSHWLRPCSAIDGKRTQVLSTTLNCQQNLSKITASMSNVLVTTVSPSSAALLHTMVSVPTLKTNFQFSLCNSLGI